MDLAMLTYTGTNGDDLVTTDADVVTLRKGNDTLYATNSVSVSANGGEGADLLIYTGAGVASMLGGDGGDTLNGAAGADSLGGENGADVLAGFGGADILSGADGNDLLLGGDGIDTLIGGYNNDTLDGGAGPDRLQGDGGIDAAAYQSAAAGVRADLVNPGANLGDAAGDVFVSIENLIGSDFADVLKGDNGSNVLSGGAGADVLAGLGNSDTLLGGDGDDTLQGQGGVDTLEGGRGDDLLLGGASARDVFVFHVYPEGEGSGWGRDTVGDYEDGLDRLDLRQAGYGETFTFDSLTISQDGADTVVLAPGAAGSIRLTDILASRITAEDFIF